MSLPISLHGNTYLEHLRDYRDVALVESNMMGKRRRVGAFTLGIAHAQWQTEDGARAHLIEAGIRYRNSNLTKIRPTTLRLTSFPAETGLEVVTFKMDIDDIGCIAVYRNMITSGSFREVARAELANRADNLHDLSDPTDEDREMLYTEMQRGATGLYPIRFEDD